LNLSSYRYHPIFSSQLLHTFLSSRFYSSSLDDPPQPRDESTSHPHFTSTLSQYNNASPSSNFQLTLDTGKDLILSLIEENSEASLKDAMLVWLQLLQEWIHAAPVETKNTIESRNGDSNILNELMTMVHKNRLHTTRFCIGTNILLLTTLFFYFSFIAGNDTCSSISCNLSCGASIHLYSNG
jgi:hypothetical protein